MIENPGKNLRRRLATGIQSGVKPYLLATGEEFQRELRLGARLAAGQSDPASAGLVPSPIQLNFCEQSGKFPPLSPRVA